MMRSVAWAVALWAGASPVFAQEVVREFSWSELKKAGELSVGTVEPGDATGPHEQLRIESPIGRNGVAGGGRITVTVLDLKNPPVTKSCWVFEGMIRTKDVKCTAIKRLSTMAIGFSFSDKPSYWGPAIPVGEIGKGLPIVATPAGDDSNWKPFKLWCNSERLADRSSGKLPRRITLDINCASPGTVFLGPVRLRQYDAASFEKLVDPALPPQPAKPWWSDQDAGWIGGIGGSVIGLLGALIGTLGGLGKARRFVIALTTALIGVGVACLVVGLIALIIGQPYAVYYPLLLGGIILTAVCGGNLPVLLRRYQQNELRKMAAMDAP